MAIFKDIPRFDGSGITEYYRVNDGKIVKLSSDYDFLDDKPMINGVVLEGDLSTADLNIPVGDITQLKTEIKDNIVNAINELQTEANDFEKFITDKVNAIISFTIVWVAELPAIKDAKPNTVYLVPKKSMIEDDKKYVIDDVRFPNEKDMIEQMGGVCWYVVRPTMSNISNHISETSLEWRQFDNVIVNNHSLNYLKYHWELFMHGGHDNSLEKRRKVYLQILGNDKIVGNIGDLIVNMHHMDGESKSFTLKDILILVSYVSDKRYIYEGLYAI